MKKITKKELKKAIERYDSSCWNGNPKKGFDIFYNWILSKE